MSTPSAPKPERLRRLTPERLIAAIRRCKGMLTLVAKELGVSYEAVRKSVHRFPTVAAALREARDEVTDTAELALYKRIQNGDPWAVQFWLKTQGKSRGFVERQEITGADGEAVPIRFIEVVKTE